MTSHAWPKGWATDPGYRDLFSRLARQHGTNRAQAIAEGRDEATNADKNAWSNLGRRSLYVAS